MQIDKDLLKYCRDNNFPTDEMVFEDFITVQNSLNFKYYKLELGLRPFYKNVLAAIKKLEHRNKSCKGFKVK